MDHSQFLAVGTPITVKADVIGQGIDGDVTILAGSIGVIDGVFKTREKCYSLYFAEFDANVPLTIEEASSVDFVVSGVSQGD